MDINIVDRAEHGRDNLCLIELTGRFDAHEIADFSTFVDQLIDEGNIGIGVELAGVAFIDSSALAELVRLSKVTAAKDGYLEIYCPSDPVRVILELTGLDKAFVVHQDRPGSAVVG